MAQGMLRFVASQTTLVNMDYVPYFEEQIKIQQDAIVSFKRWMVGFVLLGMLIIVGTITFNNKLGALASPIFGIGGLLVSTLAAFPYREITPRRSKIGSYLLLKRSFEKINDLPNDEQQKLKELAVETIRNNIK